MEKLDTQLLRYIFEVPNSAPVASLYLESGCVRIRNIIRGRRINFLHHLANIKKDDMLYKFFKCQWDHPCPKDWTVQVMSDLRDVGLPESMEFLTSKSEKVFKKNVKAKIKIFEFSNLLQERKSKTINLKYSHLKMQDYLLLKNMNKKETIILFKFRTRMAPFRENFKAKSFSSTCPFCFSHIDSQEESFNCSALNKMIMIRGKYEEIFSDTFSKDLIKTLDNIYNYRKESSLNL